MKELLILFGLFFKVGIMTFGGGYAMLPMLERELVNYGRNNGLFCRWPMHTRNYCG